MAGCGVGGDSDSLRERSEGFLGGETIRGIEEVHYVTVCTVHCALCTVHLSVQ